MHYPQKMKAAILVKQNAPLSIKTVELPSQLEVGQVLVKVAYSGLCGSQIGEIVGAKGPDKFLPHLMGHEGSGSVIAIGPGVRHISVGDTVVMHWKKGVGIESDPPKYKWNGKNVNAGWVTTFNEFAIVSENRLTPVFNNLNLKTLALFGCAITTGFGVIENNADVKIGESVVVYGSGGVGLNIIQAASLRSALPIIAIDRHDNRLELAKKLGATHLINSSKSNVKNELLAITNNHKIDVFIDNTGKPDVIELGYHLTGNQGRVVLVGVPKIGDNINIFSLPLHFGKSISGSHGGEVNPNEDIPRYLKMMQKEKIDLEALITEEYALEDINTAIDRMISGKTKGRCVISFRD